MCTNLLYQIKIQFFNAIKFCLFQNKTLSYIGINIYQVYFYVFYIQCKITLTATFIFNKCELR